MNLEDLLQTYTLEEILELNELTEAEVLEFLLDAKLVKLPDVLPVSFDD